MSSGSCGLAALAPEQGDAVPPAAERAAAGGSDERGQRRVGLVEPQSDCHGIFEQTVDVGGFAQRISP
jgi:hypothetical protein